MANMLFANNCNTTLNGGISAIATSMVVASATGFPTPTGSQYFYCTLADAATQTTIEIVKVTAVSGTTFTIVRGQDGTTGTIFASGAVVSLRLVAASLNDFPKLDEDNNFTGTITFSTPLLATNMVQSTTSTSGYLPNTDWNTFNGKAPAVTYTTNYVPYGQGTTTPNQSSALQFDGSNLGIGITPSSWNVSAIEIAGRVGICGAGNYSSISNNAYYNSGWIYKATAKASLYVEGDGTHQWLVAPSGTAGNAISWTTAMNIANSGTIQTLSTISVGNATPSASGAGITFPATQSASTDANTLDDYEEGTWTPTLFGFVQVVGAGSITTTGTYTKIGRLVELNCSIVCAGGATIAGVAAVGSYINGLPFTPAISSGGTWENATSFAAFGGILVLGGTASLFVTTSWAAQSATFVFEAKYTV